MAVLNPYMTPEEVRQEFRKVYLEENYNFLEDDLVKLANHFIMAASNRIAKVERDQCVKVVRSLNTLVADKLQEVRGNL